MAVDQIVFRFPRDRIKERSQLTVIARFRERATDADVVPTTVSFRLDCLNNGAVIADWATVTAAAEATIAITPDQNQCVTRDEVQRTLLTVSADRGIATEFVESFEFEIVNLGLRIHP